MNEQKNEQNEQPATDTAQGEQAAPQLSLYEQLRNVYLNGIRFIEPAKPNEENPTLDAKGTIHDLLVLIDALATFGHAIACTAMVEEKPETFQQRKNLRDGIMGTFTSEFRFCQAINNRRQYELLVANGVDPENQEAVEAFMKNAANTIVLSLPPEPKAEEPLIVEARN